MNEKNDTNNNILKQNKELTFNVIFIYDGVSSPLKVKENEKMKDIVKRFALGEGVVLENASFLYNGDIFVYEKKNNDDLKDLKHVKDFGDGTVNDFANELGKRIKLMAIIVYDDDTISLVCNEPINIINTNNNNIPPKKIHIFFNYYNNPPYPLNVEKNEKIKDVFNRYAQENEKDINQLDFFFL